jgi:hypothetical protein
LEKNIVINLDLKKLDAKNIDLLNIYNLLKNNNINNTL